MLKLRAGTHYDASPLFYSLADNNLFQYTKEMRRLIYPTNTIKGYHSQIRKVKKDKSVFSSDTALEELVYLKFVYLTYRDIIRKRMIPLTNRTPI
jgi:putative transposase